jgi:hypothetical protein
MRSFTNWAPRCVYVIMTINYRRIRWVGHRDARVKKTIHTNLWFGYREEGDNWLRCGRWEDTRKLDVQGMGKVEVNIVRVTGVGFLLTALSLGTRFYINFKRLLLTLSCLKLLNVCLGLNWFCHVFCIRLVWLYCKRTELDSYIEFPIFFCALNNEHKNVFKALVLRVRKKSFLLTITLAVSSVTLLY